MKVFLDRNKTLLPRIDVIYLLARLMTLTGIAWMALFGYGTLEPPSFTIMAILLGTFALHLLLFYIAMQGRFDLKLAYLSAIVYDLLLIPLLITYSGGPGSSFYLLYYLTISVAAYVLVFWVATAFTAIACASYLAVIFADINITNLYDILIRIGFVWVYFLAISYASEHMRRSERRLLKLFDTLNQRTSELEKSQAQVEMIYENSRVLASILDSDGVVREVTKILGNVLQYDHFAMVLRDRYSNLFYRSRSINGRNNFHPQAIDADQMGLVRRVCDVGEPIRLKDLNGREDYQPLGEDSRSLLVVPMKSHGQVHGALTAESVNKDHFKERDLQMLSIVSRSAALAFENAELHRRTEELTVIDELTETYNYRYFVQKLQEEKRRALRYNLPLSLIMVDIDWFKKLNDSLGHEAGNRVLKQLSAVIKSCIRDVDVFSRYGGEEFMVILPQTTQHEAATLGERIRAKVERTKFETAMGQISSVTVSVGVSSFPENGRSHEDLVSITDQALYRAKGEGRNLVCTI